MSLQNCAECGADASKHSQIVNHKGRETHDRNIVSMQCTACGYTISVATSKKPAIIRDLWNVRTINPLI